MIENWMKVKGYPSYEVSDLGRVRVLDKVVSAKAGSTALRKGKVLKPRKTGGYLRVALTNDEGVWHVYVHVLVARAFIGKKPRKWEAHHINGNPLDNRGVNLRYVEMKAHRRISASTILTNDQVVEIYGRSKAGERSVQLAKEFGVSRQLIADIKGERTRADITVGHSTARRKVR